MGHKEVTSMAAMGCMSAALALVTYGWYWSRRPQGTLPTKRVRKLVVSEPHAEFDQVKFTVKEQDMPKPGVGQVLVRMEAVPVHQSDCSEWRIKKGGVGHEGCGVVVASGGGFRANRLVGKRVGVMLSRSGTVTEYLCCDASNDVFVLPLSDDVALEDAASWFVDPLTAIAILETAQKHNANAIIQTAAPSLQGQMLIKLAARQGITLVNVVRTRKQWKAFKNMGASLVICTVDPDWTHQLKALIKTLDIRVAFDAIAGDMTGSLLKCLPNRSTVYVHGILTSEPVSGIDPTDLIYRRKQILGFHMAQDWLLMGGPANVSQRIEQNLALIASGLAPDGWATSQFVDCHMDTVQETFCDLWKNGFTGKKLRIRLC